MERKVLYRDRQEFQAADLVNQQVFTDEAVSHIITDAITPERQIVGLGVSLKSATEITVAIGRLWDGTSGKVYRQDEAETISVFSYLPLSEKKILSVVVIGQTIERDIQPRDFVIDIQTEQTEPRAVAMEEARVIDVSIIAGVESASPQAPAVPVGYTEIAQIELNSTGIQKISLASNKKLPRLHETEQRLVVVETWKDTAAPQIATLASDIAGISKRLQQTGKENITTELAADVARLKTIANLPDSYASYGQDSFLSKDETNETHAEHYALTEEGIRFPWAGQDESQPDLFNPYDSAVAKFSGFVVPAFDEEIRFETTQYSGDLSISQYQYTTHELKTGAIAQVRRREGPTRVVCTNARGYTGDPDNYIKNVLGVQNYTRDDPYGFHGGTYWIRYTEYWEDVIQVPYTFYETVNHSINGSLVGQTYANGQNSWLSKISMFFTQKDANGIVYVAITETDHGKPDPTRTIAITQVDPTNIKTYPVETPFVFPHPVFLEAGKRYAFLVITAGNHRVATVSGQEYTQGTIFYSLDGEFFQGDFTKDLMMRMYFCRFKSTYSTVVLQPASLANGIADIDLKLNGVFPEGTELVAEFQYNGKWYPMSQATAAQLRGLPAMLPIRLVFVGSSVLMPAVEFPGSFLRVSRPAATFRHISKKRTLPAPTNRVEVQALLEHYDETNHDCAIKLIVDPDGTPSIKTPDTVEDRYDPDGIRRVATFSSITNVSSYAVRIDGTTTTPLDVFLVAERVDLAF